ncbi:HlyD family secretion protein [Niabella ginsengisoli]|uniref:HlyD family secretion protein n=1 Tax=Niabella ginsengisoli TaxID=522298 RepID=A0ABS9SR46_9BACT|nr:HlyD family secretion protein [Niabella ginsengisoli]MCH5600842.1 HlyD family secretion protein [Niabella ginsengisoli]
MPEQIPKSKIFPIEIVDYTVEKHFSAYNPTSRRLYLIVLGVFFLFVILMFIIRVDVSVKSVGIIRPLQERANIRSAFDGVIDSLYVKENSHVEAGQVIMKIRSKAIDERGLALSSEKDKLTAEVSDLRKLLSGSGGGLESSVYAQQYNLYRQKLSDVQLRYDLARKNFNRYTTLYKGKVISAAEYDRYKYEMKAVESEVALVKEAQQSQWQADLMTLERQLIESGANVNIAEERKDMYTIKAQVSGTVQGLSEIQEGSFISATQSLGEISPDSMLIAEAYIPSKDIGLIKLGAPVRIQVDAFDYNVWGMLTGKVESISSDIYTDAEQPYFKVRCTLNQHYLKLRNGYKGYIKKGMALQTRFRITRRSLYQLLYDQTDDWLNPNIIKEKNI